ncbi:MAG: oxidoreductase [Methanomethylophilus sp.]|nr:oxidoreductase [Methanomethylophilus sp.]
MMHLEEGNKQSYWADGLPVGISVLRPFDRVQLAVWTLSFFICGVYAVWRVVGGTAVYDVLQWMALPFAVCGGLYFLHHKIWVPLIVLLAAVAVLYVAGLPHYLIYALAYVFVGAVGVAAVVDALQRQIFYRTLNRVRYLNLKKHLSLTDRFTAFLYNIPPDLDTRNLSISAPPVRRRFPWRNLGSSVVLSLGVGMFFWIYLSMNPSFVTVDYSQSVPLFIFTLMLYIPVLILPFSVFQSLDARLVTGFRDFRLYNGAVATIQRMAVPVFAALVFVLLALDQDEPGRVLAYIALSAVMILFTVGITALIYYYAMAAQTAADIRTKWKLFIPVPLYGGLAEPKEEAAVPGTPVRDETDFGRLTLPPQK